MLGTLRGSIMAAGVGSVMGDFGIRGIGLRCGLAGGWVEEKDLASDGGSSLVRSLCRRDLELVSVMVWLLATLLGAFVSDMTSAEGTAFLAWATARGPAHCGRLGRPILAKAKLARTVTGRMFSLILSCLPESERPKTICWTLLYTLRQVWNACACGAEARSCRYVWKSQKV